MPRTVRPGSSRLVRTPAAVALGVVAAALLLVAAALGDREGTAEAARLVDVHLRIAVPSGGGDWREIDLKLLLLVEPGDDPVEETAIARAGMLERFPGAIDLLRGGAGAQYVTTGYSWPAHTATYAYNPAGRPAGLQGHDAAIATVAATWNGAGGADWSYSRGPDTSAGPGLCQDGTPDGLSTVAWVDTLPGSTLATTCTYFPGGKVKESDIALDASRQWTTDPADIVIDLPSVVLHEFGHMLGLGHSADAGSVMYGTYPRKTNKRELTPDDLAGLISVYGAALAEPASTPTATLTPTSTLLVPGISAN